MEGKYKPHIVKLALHLNEAVIQKEGVGPVIAEHPSLTVAEAYGVQLYNVKQQLHGGKQVVGKKIGLTSKTMQELIGVDEPDYGHLLTQMEILNAYPYISMGQVLQPRVEGELAFILKKDLMGPTITVSDVLEATEKIVAAIEIVDSRIADWNISFRDMVADNCSSAFYILGTNGVNPNEFDRLGVGMKLFKNNQLINQGKGADVLGDPAYCVAWLANKLSEFDITLKAGEVILSGAFSEAIEAESGDQFRCEFTNGLGMVHLNFE